MTRTVHVDLIRAVPLFSWVTDEQARELAEGATRRRFRRGENLVEQGGKSGALFILLNGSARVLAADRRGREVSLAVLRHGDPVGEMSLIDDEPHSATVRAEVQTDALVLGRAEFMRLLPGDTSLAHALMRGLVQRLRGANEQIQSLALLDVYGRVARALLSMSEVVDEGRVIRERVSRQRLAEIVGASREKVGRVMKELEANGVVHLDARGWLTLRDGMQAGSSGRRSLY
ncbi:Crp/Fnr family transcriptional regulator [Schlegelella sp. ID0723]|uniref:Crp/Fnr family transcriptional regulator n=1 Tax=Piscinibacter koreensis TaxID=2742824 RepID=A0A7Y6TVN4_9BURK|nr:Crp/Fnr family transcriptional regulator [Schlegelella koreensis]